jgi:hypothetical protein
MGNSSSSSEGRTAVPTKDPKKNDDLESGAKEEKEGAEGKEEVKELASKALTFYELMVVLKPFFWPDAGSDGALINRTRAFSTWLSVLVSKSCSLTSPFFLLNATNQLTKGEYGTCKVLKCTHQF